MIESFVKILENLFTQVFFFVFLIFIKMKKEEYLITIFKHKKSRANGFTTQNYLDNKNYNINFSKNKLLLGVNS